MSNRTHSTALALVLLLLGLTLLPGCSALSAGSSSDSAAATTSSDTPDDGEIIGRMPGLEFIDVSSLPANADLGIGVQLTADDYNVLISGDQVASVYWREVEDVGMGESSMSLDIEFDQDGAQALEDVTTRLVGDVLPIALDGRIIYAPTINEPIAVGRLTLMGYKDSELCDFIESNIVVSN